LQIFCKDWFVIVVSETGKQPGNKEKKIKTDKRDKKRKAGKDYEEDK